LPGDWLIGNIGGTWPRRPLHVCREKRSGLSPDLSSGFYEPIAQSRREANKIKRDVPVLVVLGNPPYKDKSGGKGGWIEAGNLAVGQKAPMTDFIPPTDWGIGVHVRHIYNLYVYFWRWATWKVFDHHAESDQGVVCLITAAGFLDGPGFERMRDYLRRRADAVWVIDCSPEGYQPPVKSRIFEAMQQPVCITLALRDGSTGPSTPAPVYFRRLASGTREEKFAELTELTLVAPGWAECSPAWRAPFLPAGDTQWVSQPAVEDLLRYSGTGIMSGRTWIVAPDVESLRRRWNQLMAASVAEKPALMQEHRRDRNINKVLTDGLPGFTATKTPIKDESGPCPDPVRIGYRSFDRQWIIPDKRLINQPNPTLWGVRSDSQVYLTAPQDSTPTSGPAATLTAYVPDVHHYKGSFGGRVYPLWLDPAGMVPNVVPGLLDLLAAGYGHAVTAEDLFAYLAAVLANPAYTERFAAELSAPGLRVPLTADASLFARAAALGRRIIWLHSYGRRSTDSKDNRPHHSPRMELDRRPKVLQGAPIPADAEHMPDEIGYDLATGELRIGTGRIGNVTPEMWSYNISGVNVLTKWFSYRKKTRDRPVMGDRRVSALQDIQPGEWPPDYTRELIDLLNVLGLLTDLESAQSELLTAICGGSLITIGDLHEAGVLPVPSEARTVTPTWQHSGKSDQLF
jgi:hypothetical protein